MKACRVAQDEISAGKVTFSVVEQEAETPAAELEL